MKYITENPTIGTLDYWIKVITGQLEHSSVALYETLCKPLELTKTEDWSFEKEWRVITFESTSAELFNDYPVPPRTFSKVFLGNKISSKDRHDIEKLLKFDLAHIELYDMETDQSSRTIKFNRIEKGI